MEIRNMKPLHELKEQHGKLRERVLALQTLLRSDATKNKANQQLADTMLREFLVEVRDHLKLEDHDLYPELLVHEDPMVKQTAWGFIRGESPLRKEIEQYAKKWLKGDELTITDSFLQDTNEVFEALFKRMDSEEQVLFPRLESSNVDRGTPSAMKALVDVIVHLDETLDKKQREALVDHVRQEDGVVSVALREKTTHLMIVEYIPDVTSSAKILKRVTDQGVHAELAGL
jgi:hemerythrin superfamily protein